jgi:hypothetical protein
MADVSIGRNHTRNTRKTWLKRLAGFAGLLVIANEIRGVILAAPVFYGIWQGGGIGASVMLAMAVIALSVVLPWWLLRKMVNSARQ